MTMLLASVTGPEEAEIALAHGADVIDLKDASKGALGVVAHEIVRVSVRRVDGRRYVSAVTGDLPMQPECLVDAVKRMAETGVDYVKVGLFPGPNREACVRALSVPARATKLVGVMFADCAPDGALLPLMADAGFAGVMLDTANKGNGRLLDHLDAAALQRFVAACREHGLMAGLAGSLEAPDVPRLLLLAPDYLGFRGALCPGRDRAGRIDPQALRLIRDLIPPDERSRSRPEPLGAKADYRLLAARGYSVDSDDHAATDRIFVRDFVLPVRVGAYAHEREKPQNVRFDVDVRVRRVGRPSADMRDVFSYDVITDGIRIVVAQEHIPLIETLAERVADLVLAHAPVVSVTVRVEKLDLGSGRVGVEIRRDRSAAVAEVFRLYPAAAGGPPKAAE